MSTEINTRGMVRSKAPGFPAGNDNECLRKAEIINTGKALVNSTYGDNECPVIDNIVPSKDIALGYVDANNKVHYIATLMNNPTLSRAAIKSTVGDINSTIILFIGYSNFMNATSHKTILEQEMGQIWLKLPCFNNSNGSCIFNSPLTKIDDYSCYTGGLLVLPTEIGTHLYRFKATAVNALNGTEEYSPVIYFTLTE